MVTIHKNSSMDAILAWVLKRPTTEVKELAERINAYDLTECEVLTKGNKKVIVKSIRAKVSKGILVNVLDDMYENLFTYTEVDHEDEYELSGDDDTEYELGDDENESEDDESELDEDVNYGCDEE